MSFTERFIELKVDLYNKETAEAIGYNERSIEREAIFKVDPYQISHYGEGLDDNQELTHTAIFFKNGENMVITMPLSEFEKLLNNFQK